MANRTIGLDIGTHAVRAAQIAFGRGKPVLERFGQVALPYGAVVAGEVVDPPAVAAALRRLWREGGFKHKSVVVGVANQRVVARTVEVQDMSDSELRSALPFQVQELIPIPVDDAILDYQVLERTVSEENNPSLRLLLVAAHKDMVASLLAALEGAGLSANRIDLAPFALVRALYAEGLGLAEDDDDPDAPQAEAIVGIGAGVTTVVVHEHGVPRFVRNLTLGGNTLTEALAGELSVDIDDAEDLKRRASSGSAVAEEARASQLVAGTMTPLLEEIRGSLDFFQAQADGGQLRKLVVTMGGSRLPELSQRLDRMLGVPVEWADPFQNIDLGNTGLSLELLHASADLMAVPIGLALSGESMPNGARRITILPGSVAVKVQARREAVMAGMAVVGVGAALVGLFLLGKGTANEAQDAADAEQNRTAPLQAEVAELADYANLEQTLVARRQTVVTLLSTDIAWSTLFQEVATVMPQDTWLVGFTANAPTGGLAAAPGSLAVQVTGFDHTSTARWLLRLSELDAITALWVPSSTLVPATDTGPQLVNFSSDAQLTGQAISDRSETFVDGEPS